MPASNQDPLVGELRQIRQRQLERVDMWLGRRPPLGIPILRTIIKGRYPDDEAPLALRWLLKEALDGCDGMPRMQDPHRTWLRMLFGLVRPVGSDTNPTDWRRAVAEQVDPKKYFTNGKWTYGDRSLWAREGEARLLTELAGRIRRIGTALAGRRSGPGSPASENDRATRAEFEEARDCMRSHVSQLMQRAQDHHNALRADRGIPLLSRPGWIPSRPIPLEQVSTIYDEFCDNNEQLAAARRQLVEYWPARGRSRIQAYSTATERFDKPAYFFNGTSYRLTRVEPSDEVPTLGFTGTQYWDHYDTSEALLFEAAWQYGMSRDNSQFEGHYRRFLGDPFNLNNRSAIPGVNTLTIRRSNRGNMFYLVHRGSVATAMGTMHVIPAGEFQPSRDLRRDGYNGKWPLDAMTKELSIAATMIREYVEELLDHEESRDPSQPRIDVSRDDPYRRVYEAIESEYAQAWYLGIGLYPLTWKPEILTLCVFDAEIFDDVFADMVETGAEGKIIGSGQRIAVDGGKSIHYDVKPNRPYEGLDFKSHAREYADHPSTLPAGRACLELALRHRELLGLA